MYRRLCTERGVKVHSLLEKVLDTAGLEVDLSALYAGTKQCRLVLEVIRDSMKTIERLSLAGNSLSPDTITFLCEVVKTLAYLEKIDLSKNQLGIQSGRELLAMVQQSENVLFLNLEDTLLPEYLLEDINTQLEANRYALDNKNKTVAKQEVNEDTKYNWDWLSNVGDEAAFIRDQELVNGVVNDPTAQPPLETGSSPTALALAGRSEEPSNLITATSAPNPAITSNSSNASTALQTQQHHSSTAHHAMSPPPAVARRPRQMMGDTLNSIPLFLQPNELQLSMGLQETKFCDEEFPAEPTALFSCLTHHEARLLCKGVTWKRVTELEGCTSTPVVFPAANGGFLSYIHQGTMFATRWFRSALIVAQQDPMALKLICVKSFSDVGMYTFRFHKCGIPVDVTVDDRIPVYEVSGKPCGCHHQNPNDVFAPLVEKAYAKLHGGYDKLNRGSLTTALGDLYGGVTLKTSWVLPSVKKTIEQTVERVRHAVVRGTLVVAQSTCVGELQEKSQWAAGIEPNLAYVVNGVKQVANYTLFRLVASNPDMCWNGRFAADTAEYMEFANELPINQDTIQSPVSVDGEKSRRQNNAGNAWFWMPVEDFVSFFSSIREVRHPLHVAAAIEQHNVTQRAFVMGEGGLYGTNAWANNCSYYVSAVEKNLDVVILLSQPDQRLKANQPLEYATSLQLHAMRIPEGTSNPTTKCRTFNAEDILVASPLVKNREVAIALTLQPHQPIHIVATVAGSSSCPFEIRVTAASSFRFAELSDRLMHSTLHGEWLDSSAAGRIDARNNYAGLRNPQFSFKVDRPQPIGFLLSQLREDAQPYTIALTCYKSERQISTLGGPEAPELFFSSNYHAERSVGVPVRFFEAGTYVLIPSTWSAGDEAPFAIRVFSEFPVDGSRMNV